MRCPVCQNDTFDDNDYLFNICKECFWEYDDFQVDNPDFSGSANGHSLNEYRKIYNILKNNNPNFSCKNPADRNLIIKLDHNIM